MKRRRSSEVHNCLYSVGNETLPEEIGEELKPGGVIEIDAEDTGKYSF